MHSVDYPKWLNFVWFQCIWFIAILGREQTQWPLLALLLMHLAWCKDWKVEARLMLLCATVGVVLDSLFTWQGVFKFAEPTILLPIPVWLVAIWLAFAGTLRHSLDYLLEKPVLAALCAGISAPLSYLAGMRLGAVEFGLSSLTTMSLIAVAWTGAMPLLIYISNKLVSSTKALPHADVLATEQIGK